MTSLVTYNTTFYAATGGYKWLPGLLAILKGIQEYEVIQALTAARRWPQAAVGPHGLVFLTILARTKAGRYVAVVLRRDEGMDWWIVGAREMRSDEAAAYDRWEAGP